MMLTMPIMRPSVHMCAIEPEVIVTANLMWCLMLVFVTSMPIATSVLLRMPTWRSAVADRGLALLCPNSAGGWSGPLGVRKFLSASFWEPASIGAPVPWASFTNIRGPERLVETLSTISWLVKLPAVAERVVVISKVKGGVRVHVRVAGVRLSIVLRACLERICCRIRAAGSMGGRLAGRMRYIGLRVEGSVVLQVLLIRKASPWDPHVQVAVPRVSGRRQRDSGAQFHSEPGCLARSNPSQCCFSAGRRGSRTLPRQSAGTPHGPRAARGADDEGRAPPSGNYAVAPPRNMPHIHGFIVPAAGLLPESPREPSLG